MCPALSLFYIISIKHLLKDNIGESEVDSYHLYLVLL